LFERFDEHARRALFFARYEVAQLGGLTIEPEHLVLGLLRESTSTIQRFAHDGAAETIRERLARPVGQKVSTSVEIPFSRDCKAALEQTSIEADAAGNGAIRCEHLLLGVLVKTQGEAARALEAAGVRIDAIRAFLRGLPPAFPESPAAPLIFRHWKGVTKPGQEDAYVAHLERETVPALHGLAGFVHIAILRRPIEGGTEFQVITTWRSLDDIRAFAGDDVEAAVVPPAAAALLSSYDRRAAHYEMVRLKGTGR
jgi:heme-degrading monooxygenase HmoA